MKLYEHIRPFQFFRWIVMGETSFQIFLALQRTQRLTLLNSYQGSKHEQVPSDRIEFRGLYICVNGTGEKSKRTHLQRQRRFNVHTTLPHPSAFASLHSIIFTSSRLWFLSDLIAFTSPTTDRLRRWSLKTFSELSLGSRILHNLNSPSLVQAYPSFVKFQELLLGVCY